MTPIIPANTTTPSACRISAPAPRRQHQRHHARDERDRGHQDRAQSQASGLEHGGLVASSPRSSCRCLANSTIRIAFLRRKTHEHHQTHLREDVVVSVREQHARDRGQQRHRHDQHDGERQAQAFVLGGQHEEHEHHAQREHQRSSCRPTPSADTTGPSTRSSCRAAASRRGSSRSPPPLHPS